MEREKEEIWLSPMTKRLHRQKIQKANIVKWLGETFGIFHQ